MPSRGNEGACGRVGETANGRKAIFVVAGTARFTPIRRNAHADTSPLAPADDIVRRKTPFPQQLTPGRQTLHARSAAEFAGYKAKPFLK